MNIVEEILSRAKKLGGKVVLPESDDIRVLKAARKLVDDNIAQVIIIEGENTRKLATENNINLDGIEILNINCSGLIDEFAETFYELRKDKGIKKDDAHRFMLNPLYFAAMLVRKGYATSMVAGSISTTAEVVRAAIRVIGLDENVSVVSSSFIMVVPEFLGQKDKVFMFADCAIVPDPTPEQLADIAYSTSKTGKKLAMIEPVVAFLSFSTYGSAVHQLVTKVKEAVEIAHKKYPELLCDGEMQVDAAIIPEIAERKCKGSPVGGRANVLIFPDLNAGNIAYKLVERLAKAKAIGPIIQGLSKPANDLSRGCSVEDIITTAASTIIIAKG